MKKILLIALFWAGLISSSAMAQTITLNSGFSQDGIADLNQYQRYVIHASAGDTLQVDLFNQDADGDLYLKIGEEPSTGYYDCASEAGNTSDEICSVTLTQDADVYIAVYAYRCINNVQHTIKATIAEKEVRLSSGVAKRGIADLRQYQHYIIHASAGDTVKVALFDQDADGDLFVKIGEEASTGNYNCSSEGGNTSDEMCSVTLTEDAEVYIAVYAYRCINNVQHTIKATINYAQNPQNKYGEKGPDIDISQEGSDKGNYTVYYPENIQNMNPKPPLIFMVAGGGNMTADSYQVLIRFMVSRGNAVLVSKGSFDPRDIINRLDAGIVAYNILPYVDTSKIGVIGHSSGAANAFNVLKYYSDKNYGSNGRFIYSFDPYYIRNMTQDDLQTLPDNTNVIVVQSSKNGKGSDNQTPKVALTIYSLLDSIPEANKDYQVYENDGHDYISSGDYNSVGVTNMVNVLRPLDALMDYTFNNEASAQDVALGVGSDNPIIDGNVIILDDNEYEYRCIPEYNQNDIHIDYCM